MGWDELRVTGLASGFEIPLLVIHDRDDDEVPLAHGAAIAGAWPGGRSFETTGLGHNRRLRDSEVVARVVAFLDQDPRDRACGAPEEPGGAWRTSSLERELYDREARWAMVATACEARLEHRVPAGATKGS